MKHIYFFLSILLVCTSCTQKKTPAREFLRGGDISSLTYLENRGAVWGLMQGWRIVFLVATVLFLGIMIWFYAKKRRDMSLLTRIILSLLFSGAVGNLIDRAFLGYVRDMIYFRLINFPVFNVADSAITIAACLLILETFFVKSGKTTFDLLGQCFSKRDTGADHE